MRLLADSFGAPPGRQHTHEHDADRWAAFGAAVAVTLGAGGLGLVSAVGSGGHAVVVTIEPTRILDTRTGLGVSGRVANGVPAELQVTGQVSTASGAAIVVPEDAVAALVNVTVVLPDSSGYLALRPGHATGTPTTSTVNFAADSVEPNAATVDLGPGGTIQVGIVRRSGGRGPRSRRGAAVAMWRRPRARCSRVRSR